MIRTIAKVALVILVLVGLLAGTVAWYIVYVVRHVSAGKPIERFADARNALLVIDIQTTYTGPSSVCGFPSPVAMIDKTNLLVERATKAGWAVAFIGQEFPNNALFRLFSDRFSVVGHPGTEQDPRLQVASHPYFPKNVGDAFSNPALETWLAQQRVNRLTLVGLDAEACVLLTAKGARNRGFDVRVVQDAVITRSKRPLEQILNEYKTFGASVTTSEALLNGELRAHP